MEDDKILKRELKNKTKKLKKQKNNSKKQSLFNTQILNNNQQTTNSQAKLQIKQKDFRKKIEDRFAKQQLTSSDQQQQQQQTTLAKQQIQQPTTPQKLNQGQLKQDIKLDQDEIAWQTIEQNKKQKKWKNRQRTMLTCSHGVTHSIRYLLNDLYELMPHAKKEQKLQRKRAAEYLDQICYLNNCNNCVYIESHKRKNFFMWVTNSPVGPSAKFLLQNITTTKQLKMTGNCLKGSRPLLSFDKSFGQKPQLTLIKELLTHAFGTPRNHPKSKPFYDHIFSFSYNGGRIWFRNYQFLNQNQEEFDDQDQIDNAILVQIGPRFCIQPIKIFDGSIGGATIWSNPNYISEAQKKSTLMKDQKYEMRYVSEKTSELTKKQLMKNVPNKMDVGLFKHDDDDDDDDDE